MFLDLLAHSADVDIQALVAALMVLAPDSGRERGPAHRLAGPGAKFHQQLELLWRKPDIFAVLEAFPRLKIEFQVPKLSLDRTNGQIPVPSKDGLSGDQLHDISLKL
jgi:hypothetical protein